MLPLKFQPWASKQAVTQLPVWGLQHGGKNLRVQWTRVGGLIQGLIEQRIKMHFANLRVITSNCLSQAALKGCELGGLEGCRDIPQFSTEVCHRMTLHSWGILPLSCHPLNEGLLRDTAQRERDGKRGGGGGGGLGIGVMCWKGGCVCVWRNPQCHPIVLLVWRACLHCDNQELLTMEPKQFLLCRKALWYQSNDYNNNDNNNSQA